MFNHIDALISHASKVMLKILQARLQQYMNWELADVQAGFRKGKVVHLVVHLVQLVVHLVVHLVSDGPLLAK